MSDRIHEPKSADEDWKLRRACTPADAELFFPTRGTDSDPAKRICARCVVRRECLVYAMTPPLERYGTWGGLSRKERKSLDGPPAPGDPLPPIRLFADYMATPQAQAVRRKATNSAAASRTYRARQREAIAATVAEVRRLLAEWAGPTDMTAAHALAAIAKAVATTQEDQP